MIFQTLPDFNLIWRSKGRGCKGEEKRGCKGEKRGVARGKKERQSENIDRKLKL